MQKDLLIRELIERCNYATFNESHSQEFSKEVEELAKKIISFEERGEV
jgi:hypothetical protein